MVKGKGVGYVDVCRFFVSQRANTKCMDHIYDTNDTRNIHSDNNNNYIIMCSLSRAPNIYLLTILTFAVRRCQILDIGSN